MSYEYIYSTVIVVYCVLTKIIAVLKYNIIDTCLNSI